MITKTFAHHTPSNECIIKLKQLREGFSRLETLINELQVLPNREKSLALTKLEEAAMWATKSIVYNDPNSVQEKGHGERD